MTKEKICIVGAGLTGSMLAIYLARRGYQVDVFEKRKDLRKEADRSTDRSIAMSMSHRGWKALDEIDVADAVKQRAIPKYGRVSHLQDHKYQINKYSKDNQPIYAVNRNDLNNILLTRAEEYENIRLHFQHQFSGLNEADKEIQFIDQHNNITSFIYTRCIGTDGASSAVRSWIDDRKKILKKLPVLFGFIETNVPLSKHADQSFQDDYLHFWCSDSSLIISQSCVDNVFTSTFLNHLEGKDSFDELDTNDKVSEFFYQNYPSIEEHLPNLIHDYHNQPVTYIRPIKCQEWNYGDSILILGDACHAMTPFYGMGMNVCFEDCLELNKMLDQQNDDWSEVIQKFAATRKVHTDAITDMAHRHRKGIFARYNQHFDFKWKLERKINLHYPELLVPEYSLVVFSTMPLATIQEICLKQLELLEKIRVEKGEEILNDDDLFHQNIQQYFSNAECSKMLQEIQPQLEVSQ